MRIFSGNLWRAAGTREKTGFTANSQAVDTGKTIASGDILFSGKLGIGPASDQLDFSNPSAAAKASKGGLQTLFGHIGRIVGWK